MTASPGVPKGDIRWQYDLAGELPISTVEGACTRNITNFSQVVPPWT